MATEYEYVVSWRKRPIRKGGDYRGEGETTVMAENEQQAKDRTVDKLFEVGHIDYPSELEVTEVRQK